MTPEEIKILATKNLATLKANPYPGRGIIVGLGNGGFSYVIASFIMGRSLNSRNRIYKAEEGGILKTTPADPSKVEDPSLIIYTAMDQHNGRYVVSNGHQTSDILTNGFNWDFGKQMKKWSYEPDMPNFTPRITAVIESAGKNPLEAKISVIKKSSFDQRTNRLQYNLGLEPGYGYCVTTYSGDGNPLPSFEGEPFLVPLNGDAVEIAQKLWEKLNPNNRVSLAVKMIDMSTKDITIKIINKYKALV